MRLYAHLRSVFSALVGVLLISAVLSGECVACGMDVADSPQSGGCCNPDGNCKASHHKVPPVRCVKGYSSDFAVVEQVGQVVPVLPPADFCTLSSTESAPNAAILVVHADYSPPEHHILHAALLI